MSNRIILPRLLDVGAGASRKTPDILAALGCRRPLIVTDPMMVELGYVDRLVDCLQDAGIDSDRFAETQPEPTEAAILAGVEKLKAGEYDALIALGGGSPIDSAKAISILGRFGGQMRDYRFPREVSEQGLPIIAIPTTAGTGSEVTRFTIITDADKDEKMLCVGQGFMPMAALVDFELTLSLPARVTADTGIDALTHAIEAYVSAKANPYSDSQALAAMTLIGPNLRRAYHTPDDREAREAMMLGATLAGVAFSAASVALVHGMSRPIGAFFHVPHGLSNAMLLPTVTEFSLAGDPQRYADCARAIGVAGPGDATTTANRKLIDELRALNRELSVPSPVDYGIDRDRYFELRATMASQALASGSPGNNPRVPSVEEIVELYTAVWHQA